MSLGYTQQRHPRFTNLPGAVGAAVLSMPSSRRRTALPSRFASTAAARAKGGGAPPSTAAAPPSNSSQIAIVAPSREGGGGGGGAAALVHAAHDAAQWVYADAIVALKDLDTDAEVAPAGARVLLVYPMRTDADSGLVRMRLKVAHPVTGQLAHHWVAVYDPERTEAPHCATRFSLVA